MKSFSGSWKFNQDKWFYLINLSLGEWILGKGFEPLPSYDPFFIRYKSWDDKNSARRTDVVQALKPFVRHEPIFGGMCKTLFHYGCRPEFINIPPALLCLMKMTHVMWSIELEKQTMTTKQPHYSQWCDQFPSWYKPAAHFHTKAPLLS